MYKLVLVELEYHSECLRVLLQLLKKDDRIQLEACIHEQHRSLVSPYVSFSRIDLYRSGESRAKFLRSCQSRFDDSDGVFIMTMELHLKAYSWLTKNYNCLLRVHGLNYINANGASIMKTYNSLGFSGILRAFKWQDHFWRIRILKSLSAITGTLEYHQELKLPYPEKWLSHIPMTFNHYPPKVEHKKEKYHIVIPGSVTSTKRDYFQVFKVIEMLPKQGLRWVFLGSASEVVLFEKLEALKVKGFDIDYSAADVEQGDYDSEMHNADLVWSPVLPEHPFKNVVEQPGLTKISGAVSDAIYFGKPILIPSFYIQPKEFIYGWMSYSSIEELVEKIKSFTQNNAAFQPAFKGLSLKETSAETSDILIEWLNS